jgi:hypothetical protein
MKTMIEGFYFDPWHGGCLRRIVKLRKDRYLIHGVYGNDDNVRVSKRLEYHREGASTTNKYWHATLEVIARDGHLSHLHVYFGGKPTKKRLHYRAVYDGKKRVIQWDDSNEWKQMYHHHKQIA